MAKSNAERQAAYRIRHLHDEGGTGARLNLVIDGHAKHILERLSACYGVTQRAVLERLLIRAEQETLKRLAALPAGYTDYYEGRLRMDVELLRGNDKADNQPS